jgi:ketopantoate reductase
MQIAAGQGINLPADLPERRIADTYSMGAYRTSMQIDRQEGRAMEIEAILGKPLAAAVSASPYLQMLYSMAKLTSATYSPINI